MSEIVAQAAELVNGTKSDRVVTGTGEVLVDVSSSGRVNPWNEHKATALELAGLFEQARRLDRKLITPARIRDLRKCAAWLKFKGDGADRRLYDTRFCRLRLCPMCNWRRSLKMYLQVMRMQAYLAKEALRYLFLTVTLKNPAVGTLDEVRERQDGLTQALEALTRGCTALLAGKVPPTAPDGLKGLRGVLRGYMRCMEVTYNSRVDSFHPHAHILLAVKPSYFTRGYVKQSEWQTLWKWAAGLDYEPVVHICAVDMTKSTLAEICKYPLKIANLTALSDRGKAVTALINLKHALECRRLVTFGGVFKEARRQLKLDDIEDGDLINVDDKPVELSGAALVMFRYHILYGAYIC